mgnify:CR=1 FL=1
MVNYRPPPEALQKTQMGQVNSWCRYDPMICATEVGVEAAFVALGICSLLFLTSGPVPGPLQIVKFIAVFSVLNLAARMISDDLGNKVSISAVSGIGAKAAAILAPRFVGW